MSAATGSLAPVLETARGWWLWWTAELGRMLPGALTAGPPVLLAIPDPVIPDGFHFARWSRGRSTALEGDPASAGLPVWLVLPPRDTILRSVDLPAMPEADLRRALLLDLDRQTPCRPEALWVDTWIESRDAARRRVRLGFAVARAERVERARDALTRRLGSPPARIAILTPDGPACTLVPAVAPTGSAPARSRLLPTGWRGRLLLLCMLLGLLNLGLHLRAEQGRRDRLDAAVQDARLRAQRVDALRARIADRRQIYDDIMKRRGDVAILTVLEQLTRLLPDEAWLDSIEVRGASVYVTGYAPAAATLVALIETSPMFADAQFRSPVTPDRGRRRERFDMAIRLKGHP